jgi:ribokinase
VKVAVVGHVEWIQFARLEQVPLAGEIVHASEAWEEPGGGGAVAAVQLARLAGSCLFITALGDDELGHRAEAELERLGVRVAAGWRPERQRKAFVHVDAEGERTITVNADAVYFTAGDSAALQAGRSARILVASVRAKEVLASAGVQLDVLVASGNDRDERYVPGDIEPAPRLVARTAGREGGTLVTPDGVTTRWAAAGLPSRVVDAYGAGDCFAAGLTFGLGEGWSTEDSLALGARCGAACMTGRGPYDGQLRSAGAPKP